jgi:hypothetical protein
MFSLRGDHTVRIVPVALAFGLFAISALADTGLDRANQLEKSGDVAGARAALAKAVKDSPSDTGVLTGYAEFLDRYGDPEARNAYRNLSSVAKSAPALKRLVLLDLIAGDRSAAAVDLEAYRSAGGTDWKSVSLGRLLPRNSTPPQMIVVPGPLRSFARMAAISPDVEPSETLLALARNVVTNGYQAAHSNDALEQTEYLKLVHRYLAQARELEKLAGPDRVIKIATCDSAETGELLKVLGFRMRGGCGSEVVLETVNATRAFLSTDSGFPMAQLEKDLRDNTQFVYDFKPTQIPVLYTADYWVPVHDKAAPDFIDTFLSDPSLCRFYLGMAKLDTETADALKRDIALPHLRAYAHVLDFFGGMFEIRNGKAVVPGGQRSAAAWAELAGANPDNGTAFFEKLLSKDDGWLASLFDALARINGPAQDYLTEPARLKRFYAAIRGRVTSPGPARPVFRSNADMMLLTTRLRVEPNGQPHIPGNIEIWKGLFVNHPKGKYDAKLSKSAGSWKDADDVMEALFGLARKVVENEPLKIFMALSDIDRNRAQPLQAGTVDRLARAFREYGSQYPLFNTSPALSDKTIVSFVEMAEAMDKIHDPLFRQNTAGMAQALIGMWEIYSRQGLIPSSQADGSLSGIIAAFSGVTNDKQLFDAGRTGVRLLLKASGGGGEQQPQGRILALLSGGVNMSESDAQEHLVTDMEHILEAQRILSLDVIFQLADNLEGVSKGNKLDAALAAKLASRVSEIQLPRSSLSGAEKNALAFGFWTEKHIDVERKLNMRAAIDRAQKDPEKLKDLRGLLTPFLRDTLVAYNYVHYAPPGAQILYTNPLFVRSHDFIGMQGANHTWKSTELFGTGWPSNGGGRLTGSLVNLPYALAEAEQNFLVPTQTQALIWGDLVPQMILSAKIPRWWTVTPGQLHWVGTQMQHGYSLIAESALDPQVRKDVMDALNLQTPPARSFAVARDLDAGEVSTAIARLTPSELYGMAVEVQRRGTGGKCLLDDELLRLKTEDSGRMSEASISVAFGTPKPTLANSYRAELLKLRTFPTLMGYSSRIMAESWESNTLYWATLADQLHIPPSQLNVLIPEWTQKVVERIFASHLEDWPALLKSLRLVGEDVRIQAARPAGETKAGN